MRGVGLWSGKDMVGRDDGIWYPIRYPIRYYTLLTLLYLLDN